MRSALVAIYVDEHARRLILLRLLAWETFHPLSVHFLKIMDEYLFFKQSRITQFLFWGSLRFLKITPPEFRREAGLRAAWVF